MNKNKKATQSSQYKIALYVRVSTEEQAENPEGSIRNQEDRMRSAVEYKKHQGLFGDVVQLYVDAGISAKNMKRPALQDMLLAIKRQEVNLVMVTELSRLSRNTRDFIQMWDMMKDYGCKFQSLREDFDTTTSTGELILFQLMNLAQFERRQTSERVEANIAARAARGLYNGGCVPLGYQRIEEKRGYLAIDTQSSEVIKKAFEAFLKEGSLSPAAIWLNNQGYKVKRNVEGGGRYGRVGHFTVSNLQSILRNKAYLGIKAYTHRGEKKECKAVWPAIVDELTFKRANQLLDKNYRKLKPHRKNKLPYYLTGIVQCQTCDNPMSGKSANGNGGKVGYYEHAWATKRDSTLTKKIFKCAPQRVPTKKLEPLVMGKLNELLCNPSFMKKILAKVAKKHQENPHSKELERLKAKITGVNSQLAGLAERLAQLPMEVSPKPIFEHMQKLTGLKEEYEKELETLSSRGSGGLNRIVALNIFEDFAAHYQRILEEEIMVTQRKQIIAKFIRKVEVGTESVKIHYIVDGEYFEEQREEPSNAVSRHPSGASHLRAQKSGSNTLTFGTPFFSRYFILNCSHR